MTMCIADCGCAGGQSAEICTFIPSCPKCGSSEANTWAQMHRDQELQLSLMGLHADILALTIAQERMPEYPREGPIGEMLQAKMREFDEQLQRVSAGESLVDMLIKGAPLNFEPEVEPGD